VPLVIMAGGWCYTKEIVMPWYGKFFEDLDPMIAGPEGGPSSDMQRLED
jgi:hypothetical protein